MSNNGSIKGLKVGEKSRILSRPSSSTIQNLNTREIGKRAPQASKNGNVIKSQQTSGGGSKSSAGKVVAKGKPGETNNGSRGNAESGESTFSTESPTLSVPPNNDLSQLVIKMDMEEDGHRSGLVHTSYNFTNSILGSGIIGMAYALHQAGFWAGIALMLVVAIITDFSLILMIRSGHLAGSFTYQGMVEVAFGKPGYYLLSIVQFMYPFIGMISYNVIVGDTLSKVLYYFMSPQQGVSLDQQEFRREAVVLVATLFITLPFSLYRNIARLSRVSFVGLLSLLVILFAIVIRLGSMNIPSTPDAWDLVRPSGISKCIGIISFAFMCHHNTFLLYGSMKDSSEQNWKKVTHFSVGGSFLMCLLFSVVGYCTFTGYTQGDILNNYCSTDQLINFSRVLFCLSTLFTYPMECFVAREVIENILFTGRNKTKTRHFLITFLLVLVTYTISVSTTCLGVVLELNGVLCAVPLAYVFPSLCFIKLEQSPILSKTKLPALFTAIFGCLVSLTGMIELILNGIDSDNCSHGKQMPYCTQISNATV